MKKIIMLSLLTLLVVLSGCRRPYKETIYTLVNPNETAFVIPLEGANKTKQSKFGSVEYLESMKVATKRIEIPQRWHQTGRRDYEGEYIPTVAVIKVDRSPVTREWTSQEGNGTSAKDEAISVESKESIGFGVGVTISASVPEAYTSRFLYYYSGKSLKRIIDLNVRSYVQDFLAKEFAHGTLNYDRNNKGKIFTMLRDSTRTFFKEKGIHVENVGAAGQFIYNEAKIQTAINDKFVTAMKVKASDDAVLAANKFAVARKSIEAQENLSADVHIKHAFAKYLENWNGAYPTTMAGSLQDLASFGLASGVLK